MRLYQLKNTIPDEQYLLFNVKGCDPKHAPVYTWKELKSRLKLHGWCCKVSQISTGRYLYLEVINNRINKQTDI